MRVNCSHSHCWITLTVIAGITVAPNHNDDCGSRMKRFPSDCILKLIASVTERLLVACIEHPEELATVD